MFDELRKDGKGFINVLQESFVAVILLGTVITGIVIIVSLYQAIVEPIDETAKKGALANSAWNVSHNPDFPPRC